MSLDSLLQHPALWRAREQGGATGRAGLPTGYAVLDRVLPGGGWPLQGLVEILLAQAQPQCNSVADIPSRMFLAVLKLPENR